MALHLDEGSVDLVVADGDLRAALDELFSQMQVKYDLPPEVEGTVTISLHHASYRQVLTELLRPYYTYTIGPHETIYVHRTGTTWKPGWEEAA